jgi:hypothetical protein
MAGERPISGSSSGVGFRRAALLAPTGLGQRAADDADDLAEVEGLWEVLERALLGGRERRHQRVLRAHDDDGQVWPQLLDAGYQVEGVLVGHHHVGDDDIALALRTHRHSVAALPVARGA